jgi:hypothetical protein
VNASLGLDGHGKALSFLLLSATIPVSADLLADETGRRVVAPFIRS